MRKRKKENPRIFYASNAWYPVYPQPPTYVVWNAFHLLFGYTHDNNDDAIKRFFDYVKNRYMRFGVCVLWERNEQFLKLCKETGLELGKQEVIITKSKEILYSSDYHNKPETIAI